MNSATNGLTEAQVSFGLRQIIRDGLATEAMSCLTEGTFLVALALQLGASHFQIGLLAALPTLTNIFQVLAIWLVQKVGNRRSITVFSLAFARIPLLLVGILPFWLSNESALLTLTILMFIHYFFGSIAGASWNSWVKDLVPSNQLGSYFSRRTRLTQTLNVLLGISLAFTTNYISTHHPEYVPGTFPFLFVAGGLSGMISIIALYRAPEPTPLKTNGNILSQFIAVFRDTNFLRLLSFNSFWIFAFNLASPFLSVFMMKYLHLTVSSILVINMVGQLSGILFIRLWGKYADLYSNKTVLGICIPLYVLCLVAWTMVGELTSHHLIIVVLGIISTISGIATSGINLGLTNAGLKLAPTGNAISYLAAKNMFTALFSAAAPLLSGMLSDRIGEHEVTWFLDLGNFSFRIFHLEGIGFLFFTSALLGISTLWLLNRFKETGEAQRKVVLRELRTDLLREKQKIIELGTARVRRVIRKVVID